MSGVQVDSARDGVEGKAVVAEVVGTSPAKIALSKLRRDKVAVASGIVIAALFLLAIFAPIITRLWGISTAPNNPGINLNPLTGNLPVIGPPNHGFLWAHPLGLSPINASDNLAQLLYGLRTDLGISVLATVATTVIGTVLGLVAGYSRGFGDRLISFTTDTFLCFPFILGALSLAPIISGRFSGDPGLLTWAQIISLVIILIVFGWMGLARLLRGYVITLREREFVQSAQVIGLPTRKILFSELLPNLIAPLVISVSLTLPDYVSVEAGLSFLGLGITGSPSLGQMISTATPYYASYPLYLYAPVAVLTVLVLGLNLLGDSIRDAFDPQVRR